MIQLTKLNGDPLVLNAELIESISAHPDTAVTLTNGNRILVKDSPAEVMAKVLEYKKTVNSQTREPVNLCEKNGDASNSST